MYRRRPRARHDVGVEPLDWFRIGLVLTVVLVASGGGLTVAGLLRQGPLRDIGWTDRRLERIAVESPGQGDRFLGIGAAVPASSCTLELTVDVVETSTEVLVGPVRSREPRLPFTAPDCAGGRERVNGRVYAVAPLAAPVGTRDVLNASTRREIPVVVSRAALAEDARDARGTGEPVRPGARVPTQRPASPTPAATVTGR